MAFSLGNAGALIGSVAVLAAGLGVAAPAHADDTQDQIFLTSLGNRNISCASLPGCGGNDQLLSLGQALCADLAITRDPLVQANYLISQQGFTKFQAAVVLGSAQETAFRFTDGSGRDAAIAGCLATGLRALNAVPAVNDLPAGWVTALDLPLIPGRGTVR